MKKLGFMGFVSAVVLVLAALPASAVTIDFEDLGVAAGTQINPGDGVTTSSGGFDFTPGPNNDSGLNDSHYGSETFWSWNGTTVATFHDDVVMTASTGGVFSLSGFDFGGFPNGFETAFSVTGNYFGGGSIVANFTPDGITDGIGGATDFETFSLNVAVWNNLTSVVWEHSGAGTLQGDFSLDNIQTDPVPEPATLSLLGMGLAGLAWRKRRAIAA